MGNSCCSIERENAAAAAAAGATEGDVATDVKTELKVETDEVVVVDDQAKKEQVVEVDEVVTDDRPKDPPLLLSPVKDVKVIETDDTSKAIITETEPQQQPETPPIATTADDHVEETTTTPPSPPRPSSTRGIKDWTASEVRAFVRSLGLGVVVAHAFESAGITGARLCELVDSEGGEKESAVGGVEWGRVVEGVQRVRSREASAV